MFENLTSNYYILQCQSKCQSNRTWTIWRTYLGNPCVEWL